MTDTTYTGSPEPTEPTPVPTGPALYDCGQKVPVNVPAELGDLVAAISQRIYNIVFPPHAMIVDGRVVFPLQGINADNPDLIKAICFVFTFLINSSLATPPRGPQTLDWYRRRCSSPGMMMDIAQKVAMLTAQSNGTLNVNGAQIPGFQQTLLTAVRSLMQDPKVLNAISLVGTKLRRDEDTSGTKILLAPFDPNQLGGPAFSISAGPYQLGSQQPYVYTIQFANDPPPAGNANNVTVTCPLPGTLDPTTILPGLVTFEDAIPAPSTLFQSTSLTAASPFNAPAPNAVQFTFGTAVVAGVTVLTWMLTGNPPPPGGLPPNGVGSVSFSVYPLSGQAVPAAATMNGVKVSFNAIAQTPPNPWP